MKNALATGIITLSVVALLAGCGSTSAGNSSSTASSNTTTGSSATAVTATLKQTFITVNAAAQTAIDDINAGSSIDGPMDSVKVDGKDYAVVAKDQASFDALKSRYLDFFTSSAVNELFKNVVQKNGQFVILPVTQSDNVNWYQAKVEDVKAQGTDTYAVTLEAPKGTGTDTVTQTVLISKDSNGHYVYGGSSK